MIQNEIALLVTKTAIRFTRGEESERGVFVILGRSHRSTEFSTLIVRQVPRPLAEATFHQVRRPFDATRDKLWLNADDKLIEKGKRAS